MAPKSRVCNVFAEHARAVFVLESPHVDEVAHGYPLAGSAGRTMSRWIFERDDVAFGHIAHDRSLVSRLELRLTKPYSVMNASREPLQRRAYTKNALRLPDNIDAREGLKRMLERGATLTTTHRLEALRELKAQLYSEFEKECHRGLGRQTTMVPCGNFARAFCAHLVTNSPRPGFTLIEGVPHPAARGGWRKLDPAILSKIRGLLA